MAQDLTPIVTAFFAGEGWPIEPLLEERLYETSFEGEHGAWSCHVHVYDEDGRVVFVSTALDVVPDETREAMGELCNRANFGLAMGNFELDVDEGEVRFRTSIDTSGTELTTELVRNVVVANVITFDQYLPAIEAVLAGTSPADAVAAVETAED